MSHIIFSNVELDNALNEQISSDPPIDLGSTELDCSDSQEGITDCPLLVFDNQTSPQVVANDKKDLKIDCVVVRCNDAFKCPTVVVKNCSKMVAEMVPVTRIGDDGNLSGSGVIYPSSCYRFLCMHCYNTYSTIYNLMRHLNTHSGDCQHNCDICGAAFRTKGGLAYHIDKMHSSSSQIWTADAEHYQSMIIDEIINVNCVKANNVKMRDASDHIKKEVKFCDPCLYYTKSPKRFKKHMQLHAAGVEFVVCPLCGWFLCPRRTGRHNVIHHPDCIPTELNEAVLEYNQMINIE